VLSHTRDCLSNLLLILTSDRSSSLLTPPPPTIPLALTLVHLSPSNYSISFMAAFLILVSNIVDSLFTLDRSKDNVATLLAISVRVAS
jgi:hypothetical protein